jgi:predicted AAA+ superfamily ATPase
VGLRTFWPFSYIEATSDPKIVPTIRELVQWGGLPSVIKSAQRKAVLKRYIDVYLELEIRAEGITRNLPKFSRFLEIAALATGQQISMRGLASDVGLSESTVTSWFAILEETLIGYLLPCFQKTHKRNAMTSRKFYFFDCGLSNALLNRFSLFEATPEYGIAMESYIFQNLKIYCAQNIRDNLNLLYWRSVDHEEVDFILTRDGEPFWAIEVERGLKRWIFLGSMLLQKSFLRCKKPWSPALRPQAYEPMVSKFSLWRIFFAPY